MRLLAAKVLNFGSYAELEFSFNSKGLSLIYGNTGSGKSTLQDVPSWILFGVTSKDGSVDEVRNWSNLASPTIGILEVQLSHEILKVYRIRGKQSENDLYWTTEDNQEIRGKDISETQKLLEERLGVTKELYLLAACYNEFSLAHNFFVSRAKDRKELFEKIAIMDLPIKIEKKIVDEKRKTKQIFSKVLEESNRVQGKLEQLKEMERTIDKHIEEWDRKHLRDIESIQKKLNSFDSDKELKIKDLIERSEDFDTKKYKDIQELETTKENLKYLLQQETDNCPTCNQPNKHVLQNKFTLKNVEEKLKELKNQVNIHLNSIEEVRGLENPYGDSLEQLTRQANPFLPQKDIIKCDMPILEEKEKTLKIQMDMLNKKSSALVLLNLLATLLRAELLKRSIKEIEQDMNSYLSKYFDAEIKVIFEMEGSDLNTSIYKNGHPCVYSQLSKGQKSLLKLCFAISVMKASSNRAGIHFDTLMFDEALDGLDSNLKVKAFSLFSDLSLKHDTILVIDHNTELQMMFDKQYYVELKNDESYIQEV